MTDASFGYDPHLPGNIREIFMWLCQDVADLYRKWNFYLELYSSEENSTLLSDLARASFQIIEETLRNDMTMIICRLSDPPQSSGKENLSLATLVKQCDENKKMNELLADFLAACEPIRQYRNKRVGHNDLSTRIKPHDNPLPGIGREQIERILDLAGKILNTILQTFVSGELVFTPVELGSADALIYWLKKAQEYHAEEERVLRNGMT